MNNLKSWRRHALLLLVFLIVIQFEIYENPANTKELSELCTPPNFEGTDFWQLVEPESNPVQGDWCHLLNNSQLNHLRKEALYTCNKTIMFQLVKIDENGAQV